VLARRSHEAELRDGCDGLTMGCWDVISALASDDALGAARRAFDDDLRHAAHPSRFV
jgi:hypothetical protein